MSFEFTFRNSFPRLPTNCSGLDQPAHPAVPVAVVRLNEWPFRFPKHAKRKSKQGAPE